MPSAVVVVAPILAWLGALTATHVLAAFPPDVAPLLDTRVDPCDDFYQYACGSWLTHTTIPNDRQVYSYAFNAVSDHRDTVLQQLLANEPPGSLLGDLWASCMALDAITARGSTPLQRVLAKIAATATMRDILGVVAEINVIGPSILVDIGVGADSHNASTNIVYITNGELTLPAASYYLHDTTFASVEPAFRTYIHTILSLAGVPTTLYKANDDAALVVIKLEKKIAAITPPPDQARDVVKSYNPLTYADASRQYPRAFGAWADGLHLLERSPLTVNTTIVFRSRAYFEALERLLATTALADLRLYVAFRYVSYYASYLGTPFLHARFALVGRTLNGLVTPTPRTRACTSVATTLLPHAVGQLYYARMFDASRAEQVQQLVSAIERAMAERIATVDWLDDATRAQAKAKLQRVHNLIGHSATTQPYSFTLRRDDYVGNVEKLNIYNMNRVFAKIAQPVDRTEWKMSAADVNAYYAPGQNNIVFPAAILQPPFFNSTVSPAQNLGAIGSIIGHELTHGFDTNGRKYDGSGTLREWWTPVTALRFETRAQCLKTQYHAFAVVGEGGGVLGTVDGNATLSENMADNGGMRLAFEAFRHWRERDGKALNSTMQAEIEQLFFVAFGHVWCSKTRDTLARHQLLTREPHAPNKWRVNGAVMNSRAFARAFQCPAGSRMNPTTKCEVW